MEVGVKEPLVDPVSGPYFHLTKHPGISNSGNRIDTEAN